jgi:opacity protein-like surface antigen
MPLRFSARFSMPLLAALFAAAIAGHASAASFEIAPLVGYRVGGAFHDTSIDANRDIQEHSSFGLALNLGRSPDTQWELTFSREDTTIEAIAGTLAAEPLDLRIDYLQFGGTYFWSETDRNGSEPYVVGGLGVTRFSPLRAGLDDRTEPSLNVGIGLRVPLSKRVALRIEGRGYVTLLKTDASIFCRSESVDAACTIHARAKGLWQIEGLIAVAFRL